MEISNKLFDKICTALNDGAWSGFTLSKSPKQFYETCKKAEKCHELCSETLTELLMVRNQQINK
jgi:hypothetical protein